MRHNGMSALGLVLNHTIVPAHDKKASARFFALLTKSTNPSAEALQLWQRLGLGLAQNGIHLNVHTQR